MFGRKGASLLQSKDFLQSSVANNSSASSHSYWKTIDERAISSATNAREPLDRVSTSSVAAEDVAQLQEMRSDHHSNHNQLKDKKAGWTTSFIQKAQRFVGSPFPQAQEQSLSKKSTLEQKLHPNQTQQTALQGNSLHESVATSRSIDQKLKYPPFTGPTTPALEKDTHQQKQSANFLAQKDSVMNYTTKKSAYSNEIGDDFSHPREHSAIENKGFVRQILPEEFPESDSEEVLDELEIEKPETVIGEGVSLKGQLSFKRYLCINGEFEGDLKSSGKVKVGKTGIVRSNLKLHSAVVEGKVVGDLIIDDLLELRGSAQVYGNIRARYLRVDDGVTLNGHVQIMPGGLVKAEESTLFTDKTAGLLDSTLEDNDFGL